jgi:transposase
VYSVPVKKTDTFTGSDQGAENLAMIASLIETCKLHDVNPQAYLTGTVNLCGCGRGDTHSSGWAH